MITKIDNKNFVTQQEALQIANIQFSKSNKNGKKVSNQSIFPVQDGSNPTMYIINYGGTGFIIVSADNRTEPIFAYSDINNFPLDGEYLTDGIASWLKNKNEYVKEIRKNNLDQVLLMSKVWSNCKKYDILTEKNEFKKNNIFSKNRTPTYLDYTSEGDCNNGDNMMIFTHYIAPLMLTKWGQGNGYNNLVPVKNCTGNSNNNGHALTGCVATAVAQVMKYHEFPNSYDWNNMPLSGATNETARLMSDLGLSQNLNMDYGCDDSGTDTKLAVRTFSNFGYVGTRFSNYNYGTVSNEISFGHPVILRGAEKAAFLIFGSKSGHCWVTDGLNEIQFFQCIPDPNTPGEMTSRLISESNYLHMNWGWNGNYDGWFSSGNFNPANESYNWRPDMVTNIKT